MCGIAGIIGSYNQNEINKISLSLKHRGPDGTGFFKNEKFCFIHTLLRIMDLTDNSIQPMIDSDTGNVIIFNGSIYNYKDLRRKFLSNSKIKSNTDTEVILYLYQKFGIDFVKYIKGMFAISIYDRKRNKIFIIRDRSGIKPLFYFSNSKKFIFASEIKNILSQDNVKNSLLLDYTEIVKFIGHRQLNGFGKTFLKNIKILEPGKYIDFDLIKNEFQIIKYNDKINKFTLNENCDNYFFEKKFDEAIKYHTITEHKKIACLLSGGIDSSLLSVVLKAQSMEKEIHTFSSVLNEPNEENKNIPRLVKENNFIEHYLHEDSVNFFEDHLKTIDDMDQPTPDAAMVVHNVLCREVSKNGFKVLFSGNGGDEHFFGYPLHVYGFLAESFKSKGIKHFFDKIKQLKKYSDIKDITLRSIKQLISISLLNYFKKYQLSKRIKHLDIDTKLENSNFYEKLNNNLFKNIVLNYNTHWQLQSCLDWEDKNSMAYGIESRIPYLDDNLADLSFKTNLDKHFEIGSKSLLRKHPKMPDYIMNTKQKLGFAAHLKGYIKKDEKKIEEKIFYDFKDIPLINKNKLINLLKTNKDDYSSFFRTYSYGLWYKATFK